MMKIVTQILFVILFAIIAAFIGMMASRFFIPKNAGLAGGAMVFWYGILGLIIGLIISIIICRKAGEKTIQISSMVMLLINMGIAFYIYTRMKKVKADQKSHIESIQKNRPVAPTAVADYNPLSNNIGIGMAKVKITVPKTLKFYGQADPSIMPSENTAMDSVTFKQGDHYIDIATAPPWLVPEQLKLDYQIFMFKVYAQNRNYIQVEGNKSDSKKVWISKEDADFQDWSEFFLNCHSVEAIRPQDNLVRIKPMNHAEPMLDVTPDHILQPRQVQAEWIEVDIYDQSYKKIKTGWIRWRNNEGMIIKYNLLS